MTDVYQRLRSLAAIEALRDGRIQVRFMCGYCHSESVEDMDGNLKCLSCGRETSFETAHAMRRQRMRDIIERGIDVTKRPAKRGRR